MALSDVMRAMAIGIDHIERECVRERKRENIRLKG